MNVMMLGSVSSLALISSVVPGGGGGPGHRYWRVLSVTTPSGAYAAIAELEMYSSLGGANAATTGQAIAGAERTSYEKTKAFDGNRVSNNAWGVDYAAHAAPDRWVGQDFGAPFDLHSIQITGRNDAFSDQTPTQFKVEYSDDGANWTTAWEVIGIEPFAQGESRYFTDPAKSAVQQPAIANVAYLQGFEAGTDGGTAAIAPDLGPAGSKTTLFGGAAWEGNGGSKFGSMCVVTTTSSGAYLNPDHADFALGSSDFTIEGFYKPDTLNKSNLGNQSGGMTFFSKWNTTSDQRAIAFSLCNSAGNDAARDGRYVVFLSDDGLYDVANEYIFPDIGDITLDTWHHVALVREGDTLSMYLDGIRNGPPLALPPGFTIYNNNTAPKLTYINSSRERRFSGRIDEFRISKEAVYSGPYVNVPDAPFPRA